MAEDLDQGASLRVGTDYTGEVKFFRFRGRVGSSLRRPFGFLKPDVEGAADIYIVEASFDDSVTLGQLRQVFANPHVEQAQKRVTFDVEEKAYTNRDGDPILVATHIRPL